MQWKVYKINANLLKTTNEATPNVLKATRQYLNLRTKEHIIAVEVEGVISAWSTAFCDVHVVNSDPDVLADAFHSNGVPVAVINSNRINTHRCRAAAAVKTILDKAVFQLQQ